MNDYRLAEARQQVSRKVNMAADGSNHGGQRGILGDPLGGGFTGVANSSRVTVAEVGTDGGEAEIGMQSRARCMARCRACTMRPAGQGRAGPTAARRTAY